MEFYEIYPTYIDISTCVLLYTALILSAVIAILFIITKNLKDCFLAMILKRYSETEADRCQCHPGQHNKTLFLKWYNHIINKVTNCKDICLVCVKSWVQSLGL